MALKKKVNTTAVWELALKDARANYAKLSYTQGEKTATVEIRNGGGEFTRAQVVELSELLAVVLKDWPEEREGQLSEEAGRART